MSRGNLRQPNMIYGATSQQHYPYPQISPTHDTTPNLAFPSSYEDQFNKDLYYSDCLSSSSQGKLLNTLHIGSVSSLTHTPTRPSQDSSGQYFNLIRPESHRRKRSPTQGHWDPSVTRALAPMSTPLTSSGSQPSFCSVPNREPNNTTGNKVKSMKRSQGAPSKRPTPDDFRNMVLCPRDHESVIKEYLGTDAKYTLAKNHAGMMVRSSIKSQDISDKLREVTEPLDAIEIFLGFLLDHQTIKSEQKGCVSLRICFGALTALLGDFSHGGSVENFASDPQAAVIPREYLAQFRIFNPNLREILYRLSSRLEKSMNLYRHRRSPSSSLVAKFQEMSDTLEVWHRHLRDDTFTLPSRIASEWLKNHPSQVDNRRRNQAYSEQTSPSLSDTTGPSPTQCDSNYISPISAYGEPSHPTNRSNVRSTGTDGSVQYESLFKPQTGVTYYSSSSMAPSPAPYNPSLYRSTGAFDESLNISLPDELAMFANQSPSSNTGPYHATGSGYF